MLATGVAAASVPSPTLVSVAPDPAQSGQTITITLTEDKHQSLADATFTFSAKGAVVARFDATLVRGSTAGSNTTWVANTSAPTVSSDTVGTLAATVTTTKGSVSGASGAIAFTDDGQPLNELPEAPYALVFPALLLLAFGARQVRRRSR